MANGAKRLEAYRVQWRLTRAQLAAICGVSPSQITRWLDRKRCPSYATALDVERATGVPAVSWRAEWGDI